jgi:hypothetical protein
LANIEKSYSLNNISKMKRYLILILTVILIGCSNDDENGGINIRLSNTSNYHYENVVVNTSTGRVNYGDFNPGEVSDYKSFEMAYRYAFIELSIDGKIYTLQPVDYVGEKPLEAGNYTYEIEANDSQDQFTKLTLTLVEQ